MDVDGSNSLSVREFTELYRILMRHVEARDAASKAPLPPPPAVPSTADGPMAHIRAQLRRQRQAKQVTERLRKAFAAADKDGNTVLGRVEFIVAAQKLVLDDELRGAFATKLGALRQLFDLADVDQSDTLSLDEFLAAMRNLLETEDVVQKL